MVLKLIVSFKNCLHLLKKMELSEDINNYMYIYIHMYIYILTYIDVFMCIYEYINIYIFNPI